MQRCFQGAVCVENKQQWKKEKGWKWMWTCIEQWPAKHARDEDQAGGQDESVGTNASKYTMTFG